MKQNNFDLLLIYGVVGWRLVTYVTLTIMFDSYCGNLSFESNHCYSFENKIPVSSALYTTMNAIVTAVTTYLTEYFIIRCNKLKINLLLLENRSMNDGQ